MKSSEVPDAIQALLSKIEATLKSADITPATEIVAAIQASSDRIEAALAAVESRLDEGFSRLAARVGETTARVIQLTDATVSLNRSYGEQLAFLDTARLNMRDAVQRLDSDMETIQYDITKK